MVGWIFHCISKRRVTLLLSVCMVYLAIIQSNCFLLRLFSSVRYSTDKSTRPRQILSTYMTDVALFFFFGSLALSETESQFFTYNLNWVHGELKEPVRVLWKALCSLLHNALPHRNSALRGTEDMRWPSGLHHPRQLGCFTLLYRMLCWAKGKENPAH